MHIIIPRKLIGGIGRRLRRFSTRASQTALFWYRLHDRNLLERFKHGFATKGPFIGTDSQKSEQDLYRIVSAYERAKKNQPRAAREYAVGPMWEGIIRRNFGQLLAAVERKDTASALWMLEAFHRQKFAMGAGGSYDDFQAYRQNRFYRYQFLNTWISYLRIFESIGGKEQDLAFAQVGRPVGVMTSGDIIPLEAIRYHYWAKRFHFLLDGIRRPVIAEIGGGLGGQAFKAVTTGSRNICYLIFDIPETLLVASYFLLNALPESRILLYGEDDFSRDALEEFDLILMPNFEMPNLPDLSVDLWFNACSFSEMLKMTAEEYLAQVERTCRKFFLHVNHTVRFRWNVHGKVFRNLPADQLIPDPRHFELVERNPRPFGRVEDRRFLRRHGARHEVYLYSRTA